MVSGMVKLEPLKVFLSKVKFPATVGELAKRAHETKVETSVQEFIDSMRADIMFKKADELFEQAQVYDLLLEQEQKAPPEEIRGPED